METIKFRADIEGLRGVAVLLVLLCHAQVPGFSGGFIGVDLFFVISGYLISGLLATELQSTGRLDFSNFYARRIKRLLGAFLLMLVVVCLFCFFFLPVTLQATQANSGFFTSLWSSNLLFAFSNSGYFDNQAQQSAFLHTWSLGVEEQFYLIWPVFLSLLFKLNASRSRTIALLITIVASAMACMLLSSKYANQAFYLMPTRIWEFSAGALAWFVPNRFAQLRNFGLVLVALSVALIFEVSPFPWPWALLPVLGAALIVSKAPPKGLAYTLLALSPVRFFGRISYSLYLWHWPILVLAKLYFPNLTWQDSWLALMASILVATLSERYVERPLRNGRWTSLSVIKTGILLSVIAACTIWIWRDDTFREASNTNGISKRIRQDIALPDLYYSPGFDDYYASDRFIPFTAYKPPSAPTKRVLIAGDSIAMHWLPAFEKIAEQNGWELIAATKSACPMIDAPIINGRIKRRFVECEVWRASLLDFADRYSPDLFVYGNTTTLGLHDQEWIAGGRRVLQRAAAASKDVAIIAASPTLAFEPIACLSLNGKIDKVGMENGICESPIDVKRQSEDRSRLAKIVDQFPNAKVLVLDDVVCPGQKCKATQNGRLVFRDAQHMNAQYVDTLGPQVEQALFKLFP